MWSYWLVLLLKILAIAITLIYPSAKALAQNITLDGSLGVREILKGPNYTIPQSVGQTVGNNLFHSFGKFNLTGGETAIFQSNPNIQNVFSRVTGGNQSVINGLIGTQGGVNLFLINPNGIIFGLKAQLEVGGSFVASTANALQFENLGFFSATDVNVPSPLLTTNPSALWFNQINLKATIQNNSNVELVKNSTFEAYGLRVPDGKSLLLVGGNISMDEGRLTAYGGRVELGGLAEPGNVFLLFDGNNPRLKFPENVTRASVFLTNGGRTDVQALQSSGGDIRVYAQDIKISKGGGLYAGIFQGFGEAGTVAGDITLNATGKIYITDSASNIENSVRENSKGTAGNVNITAKDGVSLEGATILSQVEPGGIGKSGNILVDAASLVLKDGGQLVTSINPTPPKIVNNPPGNAGYIEVKVRGAADILGQKVNSEGEPVPSGISSRVNQKGVGNAGDITIDSGSLNLQDGTFVTASTAGTGNAGNVDIKAKNIVSLGIGASIESKVEAGGIGKGGDISININAGNLSLANGSVIGTSTFGQGDAGNINVIAKDEVSLKGSSILSQVESGGIGKGGGILIDAASLTLKDGAQLLTSIKPTGTGKAGSVELKVTGAVDISNRSLVSVNSRGNGIAGNLKIKADTINMSNNANIIGETIFGEGGNINIDDVNLILLRRNSRISATAGEDANGGNIDINSHFVVAIPNEDSDIIARAVRGRGGNIKINAQGIFGFQISEQLTPRSDISASSDFGVNGVVEINGPDVDPSRRVVNLPDTTPNLTLAQSCQPSGLESVSRFISTESSGMPASSGDTQNIYTIWEDLRPTGGSRASLLPTVQTTDGSESTTLKPPPPPNATPLMEAQGWVKSANGKVRLVVESPTVTPYSSWKTPEACNEP